MQRGKRWLAGLCAGLALACAGSEGDRLHVVWVVLDATAARQLRAYGAAEDSAPELDAIAAEATLFERAYAQWPSTLSSTSSFLTGRYPNPTLPRERLSEPGIGTWLGAAGWRTAGFSENPYVGVEHGFAREFQHFEVAEPLRAEDGLHDRARRDTAATITRSLAWIDRDDPRAFLLYLHLLPPHAPYDPPPPFAGRFRRPGYRGRFDGSMQPVVEVMLGRASATGEDLANLRLAYLENLAYADHQLGRLVAGLRERGLLDDTLLIVSSDHGEAFGEHGVVFHGANLHEEQLHVPLVIRFPKRSPVAPGRVSAVVELTDLVPTIFDVLGQPPLEAGGQSLLRVARGEDAPRNLARAWLTLRAAVSATLIGERFKLILRSTEGVRELYDLARDPGETRSVLDQHPRAASLLDEALRRPVRRLHSEPAEVDATLRKQLEAIGYVE